MRIRSVAWLLVAVPAGAFAQVDDRELAKRNYQTGEAYYQRGEFEKALESFREAYRLVPTADLQFNIAKTCEGLGRWMEALEAYRTYLEGVPDAPDRKFVESRIAFLEKQVAASTPAVAPVSPPPSPEPAPAPAPVVAPAPETEPEPAPSVQTDTAPAPESSGGGWKRPVGWTAVVVGALAAGAGAYYGILAAQKAADLEDAEAEGGEFSETGQAIQDDGELAQKLQVLGLATGGVLLVTGIILIAIADDGGDSAATSLGNSRFVVRF
ncbi:MAG: tetratricopeptide repeat protein [Myxococcota bacterium]